MAIRQIKRPPYWLRSAKCPVNGGCAPSWDGLVFPHLYRCRLVTHLAPVGCYPFSSREFAIRKRTAVRFWDRGALPGAAGVEPPNQPRFPLRAVQRPKADWRLCLRHRRSSIRAACQPPGQPAIARGGACGNLVEVIASFGTYPEVDEQPASAGEQHGVAVDHRLMCDVRSGTSTCRTACSARRRKGIAQPHKVCLAHTARTCCLLANSPLGGGF